MRNRCGISMWATLDRAQCQEVLFAEETSQGKRLFKLGRHVVVIVRILERFNKVRLDKGETELQIELKGRKYFLPAEDAHYIYVEQPHQILRVSYLADNAGTVIQGRRFECMLERAWRNRSTDLRRRDMKRSPMSKFVSVFT